MTLINSRNNGRVALLPLSARIGHMLKMRMVGVVIRGGERGKRRERERRSHVMRQRKQVTWMIRKEWKM